MVPFLAASSARLSRALSFFVTSPVEFPLHGKFKKLKLSKEELIAFWKSVIRRVSFNVRTGEKIEDIRKGEDGVFTVVSTRRSIRPARPSFASDEPGIRANSE
jgi:hypothetical protein